MQNQIWLISHQSFRAKPQSLFADRVTSLNEMALVISAIFASLTMFLGILGIPSFIADWIQTRADMGGGGLYIYLFYAGMVVAGLLTLLGGFSFFLFYHPSSCVCCDCVGVISRSCGMTRVA